MAANCQSSFKDPDLNKRSGSNWTEIRIPFVDLGPSFLQYTGIIVKIEVCFPLWQVGHCFPRSAETQPRMVPKKAML
jgi:hypothetical protein